MARNLFWLFLLTWSNAYAWYCTYTPDTNGYMVEDSLQCYDIEESVALSQYWCVDYQPSDPICNQFATCTDQTEQRTTACTEPNTSGYVNEARFYSCNTSSWSSWTVSSSHCTPDPATCIEAVEERTVECEPGYHGSSVEQRLTTCSTPYSDPVQSTWTMISTSCTLKAADPTSIESPLNPVSPINSLDQNSVDVTTQSVKPVPMEQNPVEQENAMPTTEVEVKTEEKTESTQEPQSPETKENEEIVPGFGVVLMLNTLETLNNIYEQPVDDFIGLYQDDYAQDQNILFNFIQSDDIGNSFDSIANYRWDQLHGDHPLQRYGFSN